MADNKLNIEDYCFLCGEVKGDNGCPQEHNFKKMCLNCSSMLLNEEGEPICNNKANMEKKRASIEEAIKNASTGYTVNDLTFNLKPLALKKVTSKCGEWDLNDEVLNAIKEMFH